MFVCTLSYKLQSQEALGRPGTSALLLHRKPWAGQGISTVVTQKALGRPGESALLLLKKPWAGQGQQHCYYTGSIGQARYISTVVTQEALGEPGA